MQQLEVRTGTRTSTRSHNQQSQNCLICLGTVGTVPKCEKVPEHQLNDLFKVLKVSTTTFRNVNPVEDLPEKLLCDPCGKKIDAAVRLLYQIECLRVNFDKLASGVQKDLTNYDSTCGKENYYYSGNGGGIVCLRKALVQCFTKCKVILKGKPSIPECEKLDEDPGSEADYTGITYEDVSECDSAGIFIPDNDFLNSNVKETVDVNPPQSMKDEIDGTEDGSKSFADSWKIDHGFVYDEYRKLIGFECRRCQQKFSPPEYMTDTGAYVFKCKMSSCEKTMMTFTNLAIHHQVHCLGKGPQRKQISSYKLTSNISSKLTTSDFSSSEVKIEDNQDEVFTVVSTRLGRYYDKKGRLVDFKCLQCGIKLSLSDYPSRTIRCIPTCCDKKFSSFANLVIHHESRCKIATQVAIFNAGLARRENFVDGSCSNIKVDIISAEGPHEDSGATKHPTVANQHISENEFSIGTPSTGNLSTPSTKSTNLPSTSGRLPSWIYDNDGKIILYECPYCLNKLQLEDYALEDGGYHFECFTSCCTRTFKSFANLIFHHKGSCASRPQKLPLPLKKRKQKKDTEADCSSNKGIVKKFDGNVFTYNEYNEKVAFDCPRCHIQMSHSDFKTETDGFVYKCPWDSCTRVLKSFAHLALHHQCHCFVKPKRRKWISVNKAIGEGSTSRRVVNGREYDKNGKILSFTCPICQCSIAPADFVDAETNSFIFTCPPTCCNKAFTNFANLVSHHDARCKSEIKSVKRSKKKKPPNLNTSNVQPSVKTNRSFQCQHCLKQYDNVNCRQESSPGKIRFACDIPNCNKSFHIFSLLRRHHEATCLEKPPNASFACNLCKERFASESTLADHLKSFHTHKYNYCCEICGIGCVSSSALSGHMRSHSDVRKYQCSFCPAAFKKKYDMENHQQRLHIKTKLFMCDACGATFTTRQGLRVHRQSVHSTAGAQCPICHQVYVSEARVRQHIWSTHQQRRKSRAKDQSKPRQVRRREPIRTLPLPVISHKTGDAVVCDENIDLVLETTEIS